MMHVIPDLLLRGYSPIPVSDVDGLPHVRGWNLYRDGPMRIDDLFRWYSRNPSCGLAVLGGFNGLVPIDVDTNDPAILRAVSTALPRPVVARRGTKGCMAFYRDPTGEIAKMARKNFCTPDHKPLIEVKALGCATIPPSLHRKTGQPYIWLRCQGKDKPARTLFDTHVSELGVIAPANLRMLGTLLEPWCPAPAVREQPATSGPAPTRCSDKRMSACAEAALRSAVSCLSGLRCDRNITLLMKARCLGKFVHHGVLNGERVRSELLGACKVNGAIEKHTLRQCVWTIDSGFNRSRSDALPVLQDRPRSRAS